MDIEDDFLRAYVQCAYWLSNDESDESGGQPLDENYIEEDLAPSALGKMRKDCDAFRARCAELGLSWDGKYPRKTRSHDECTDDERAGHDFWLTRNDHGCGFWDRDLPGDLGDKLTEVAKSFGEAYLFVGDDDKVYHV